VAEGCVWSVMVVVVQSAVKRLGAFSVGAIDRAVGPAGEHRADQAFCLSVGVWAVQTTFVQIQEFQLSVRGVGFLWCESADARGRMKGAMIRASPMTPFSLPWWL
jgi:hypothetical protein